MLGIVFFDRDSTPCLPINIVCKWWDHYKEYGYVTSLVRYLDVRENMWHLVCTNECYLYSIYMYMCVYIDVCV